MKPVAATTRIGEAVRLRVHDVDADRGVIHVHDAKGGKSREVPLCPRLLGVLRKWWRHRRPAGPYLFPGRRGRPYVSERADLAFERMALLGHLGFPDAIDPVWLDSLVDAQQNDGCLPLGPGQPCHPHSTGVAVWALAHAP